MIIIYIHIFFILIIVSITIKYIIWILYTRYTKVFS